MTKSGAATRQRIVEAAVETLKQEGFAGTSARAVAKQGGFNQALVFYHFGAMNELLLAALDETSERRMVRYREALDGVDGLGRLVELAGQIYREDLDAGHMTVLAEVIAGASAMPELGPEVVARIEPWIGLTEEALGRTLDGTPLAGTVPLGELAFAVVALYLGLELLTHLQGDRARADALFAAAGRVGAPFIGGA
jgi:AcrR family transcriptional regulator